MRSSTILIIGLLASAIAKAQDSGAEASQPSDNLGPGQVAIVNGQRIPESVYRLFAVGVLQVNPDALSPEARTQVVDRLIYSTLLAQEAERTGLHTERRIAAELALQRLQILSGHMSDRVAQRNPPTEAELREIYEQSLPGLQKIEYKSRHIVVPTEAEARELLEELDDGEDFAELAEEHSTDPSGADGGDLGWLAIDSTNEPFAAALVDTAPGTHNAEPIQTQYGWHVIKVDETRQSEPPSMQAVQQELLSAYAAQKVTEYARSLREEAEVELLE